jgi:hypothetical protein
MPFRMSTGRLSSHMGIMNVQENVRSLLNRGGEESPSSLYSFTPILGSNDQVQRTPKPTSRRFTRQHLPGLRADVDHPDLPANRIPVATNLPPATEWAREPTQPRPATLSDRHPSDQLPEVDTQQHNNWDIEREGGSLDRSRHTRRHKKRRRHHHHHHRRYDYAWIRKPGKRRSSTTSSSLLHGRTRVKCISTIMSGIFLATILTVCKLHHSRNSVASMVANSLKTCHWLSLSTIFASQSISSSSLLW